MATRRRRQRGQAIVLVALMMTVLVGFVALALDSARAFDGRRVLQDSVDAGSVAGAESYQNGAGWSGAETNALHLFELDNGLYSGESCTPSVFSAPTPGAPGAQVVTTCTMAGGAGYLLTLSVADNGPGGQTFSLSAQRPLSLALMQVLGQSPTITIIAAGTATAADQARTPALAALGQGGCFGTSGTALNISSGVVSVRGDIVSNGAFSIGGLGSVNAAGDVLTRCGAPTGTGTLTYQCWPGGATQPCIAPAVRGTPRSTAYRLADPVFVAPSTASLLPQGLPGSNVVLSPGTYAVDPLFGNAGSCYFLAGGVYQWQGGMTVNSGVVSNQLRPPDEPAYNANMTRSNLATPPAPQFWRASGANCDGAFDLQPISTPGANLAHITYSIEVTAVRFDNFNSVSYRRESAPSLCRQISIADSSTAINVRVSSVPGATSYSVYASTSGCAGIFGWVGSIPMAPPPFFQANSALTNCPDVTGASGCSLGSESKLFDSTLIPSTISTCTLPPSGASGSCPPSSETKPFGTGLPNQNAFRTDSPGDLANENYCATAGGATATCPAAVTPGAVEMSLINNFCLNVTANGDAFLSSGYQYNWILYYEPPTTTCQNNLQGKVNTAPIGMSYTPGAAFRIVGGAATETSEFGGIMADSILVQGGALPLFFNANYSPHPPGTGLTG